MTWKIDNTITTENILFPQMLMDKEFLFHSNSRKLKENVPSRKILSLSPSAGEITV